MQHIIQTVAGILIFALLIVGMFVPTKDKKRRSAAVEAHGKQDDDILEQQRHTNDLLRELTGQKQDN